MSVLEEFNGSISEYEYQREQEQKQKRKRNRDAEIIQVLEDVKAEIAGNLETIIGKYDSNTKPQDMPSRKIERNNGRKEAIDIINRKIEEIERESE